MPFGIKQDIDFDHIYEAIFKRTIKALALDGKRCDESGRTGLIHKDMIERIISSDVVIVDITTNNPNVFYELGTRHTAARSGTILVRKVGSSIPFNIGGMLVFDYDDSTPEGIDLACSVLENAIKNSLLEHNIDSLVHTLIPGLNVTRRPRPLKECRKYEWHTPDGKKTIGYITGDIENINCVDVWVNPENTKMQMARLHDDSISAIIRYYGAKRDHNGHVIDDTILNQLQRLMRGSHGVEPGVVLHTASGALDQRNNVKVIVHVAAMQGEPGKGFLPIRDHSRCVGSVLKYVDGLNASTFSRNTLHSVLIPLFGSRSAGVDKQDVADAFVRAAKEHFQVTNETAIEKVYFLAYTDTDQEVCEAAMLRAGLKKVAD